MKSLTLSSLLDVVGELFSDEISIAVSDTKEYVYYRPSKRIDLKIKPGDEVKEGTIAYKALATNQKVSEFINRNIYGIPYHGQAVPFEYDGELEGCVTAIYPAMTEGKSVVTVKTSDGWKPIPFDHVAYLEAKNRKTHVFTDSLEGVNNKALQEFDYLLPRETFIRCHRSFIVNVHHIMDIFPDTHSTFVLSMDNGATTRSVRRIRVIFGNRWDFKESVEGMSANAGICLHIRQPKCEASSCQAAFQSRI